MKSAIFSITDVLYLRPHWNLIERCWFRVPYESSEIVHIPSHRDVYDHHHGAEESEYILSPPSHSRCSGCEKLTQRRFLRILMI